MARFPLMGVYTDGVGKIVVGGTAVIYDYLSSDENNPTVVSTFYENKSGGAAVTSLTTNGDGVYLGWVDSVDYGSNSIFTIITSKSTHTDVPFHFAVPGLSANATPALDNLGAVAINVSLVSDSHDVDDLGTEALAWKKLYLGSGGISFEGATDNGFQTTVNVTDPTADRAIIIPDASDTLVGKATIDTLTNKTLTSPVINTSVSGTAFLDEDDMASDSATKFCSQQSIKKYIEDTNIKNLVINGDMLIPQRGTSFATLTASQYTLDRMEWIDTGTTAGAVTITQDTDVPTVTAAGVKFMNSLKIDVTTAEDLASGNAALYLSHKIEAQNVTFFGHGAAGALSGTLSFWLKSTKTGIFTVNVDRDDATEKYSTEFTVGTTNTWEKHSVVIPGDTDGTAIADDNGIGLALQFMMAVGATGKTSTKDAWNASGSTELATSNQVNLLDNTSNNVFITGIQYVVGSVTSTFDSKDIAIELAEAKRYYERLVNDIDNTQYGSGFSRTTTEASLHLEFTNKRAIPTISSSAGNTFRVVHEVASTNLTTISFGTVSTKIALITATVASGLTVGSGCHILSTSASSSTFMAVDAEL